MCSSGRSITSFTLSMMTPIWVSPVSMMMKQVFDLGYRRYEWKCDALNAPSKRAAKRLGFEYEGTFRQLTMYKNRNRDTAWFALIDKDWPAVSAAFEAWLAADNFDQAGQQKKSLNQFMENTG